MKKINLTSALNSTSSPDSLKAGVESLSGLDLSNVRVHFNSPPSQLKSLAYAQGNDIHIAPGQEEQHLPHETWHVVQQAQGRVKPTMQMKVKTLVTDDVNLELEADAMGAKATESAP